MKYKYFKTFLFSLVLINFTYISNADIEIDKNKKISEEIVINLKSNNLRDTNKKILSLIINELNKKDRKDLHIAFLLMLTSLCLSEERDISAYKTWTIAINIYAKNNTSWEIAKKDIDSNLSKYNLNKVSEYLNLKDYYGPESDFKRKDTNTFDDIKIISDVIDGKKNIKELNKTNIVIATPIPTSTPTLLVKIIPKVSPTPSTLIIKPKIKLSDIKVNLIKNEMDIAKTSWKYFEVNYNEDTGMVNSSIKYPFTTMWDFASSLSMLVSAEKLGIIKKESFDKYLKKILDTTIKMTLYKNELPNREYKTTNAKMTIGVKESNLGSGWSALDIGRTLIWLKIIKNWYPEYSNDIDSILSKWNFRRLKTEEQMYGTYNNGLTEVLRQEGRLGYEQYAAKGFDAWGMTLTKALNYEPSKKINIFNTPMIYDTRNVAYFTSEPFFLAKMEIGNIDETFTDLTNKIYFVQKTRWSKYGVLTAITEDSLDKFPWFVYNSISFNGKPWLCTNSNGVSYPNLKTISTKAAFAWNAIFNDKYSNMLKEKVISLNNSKYGYYTGIYEKDDSLNRSININTNAVILESLLYEKMGRKAFLEK